MKRLLCLSLCFCLLLCLFGCKSNKNAENLITFYYCRANYAYGTEDAVIASEKREISANIADLKNLLALYLVGPLDETLTSPFIGSKLFSVETEEDHLLIRLISADKTMTDSKFSLGCACMVMTCLEFIEVSQVTITCGDRSITMGQDSLLLFDGITPTETITEEFQ